MMATVMLSRGWRAADDVTRAGSDDINKVATKEAGWSGGGRHLFFHHCLCLGED
jgi:hypothetical protein